MDMKTEDGRQKRTDDRHLPIPAIAERVEHFEFKNITFDVVIRLASRNINIRDGE